MCRRRLFQLLLHGVHLVRPREDAPLLLNPMLSAGEFASSIQSGGKRQTRLPGVDEATNDGSGLPNFCWLFALLLNGGLAVLVVLKRAWLEDTGIEVVVWLQAGGNCTDPTLSLPHTQPPPPNEHATRV